MDKTAASEGESMTKSIWMSLIIVSTMSAFAKPVFSPKIVGGENALQGEFSYIVSLQAKGFGHFCGGSLIASNWVLTAAHCVKGGSINEVWIGMLDQKNTAGVEKMKAIKIIAHEKYNASTMDSDFALIQLSQNSSYKPVVLNQTELMTKAVTEIMATTAGWGTLSEGSNSLPNILQKVSIPLVSEAECNTTDAYSGEITDSMLCGGYKNGGKDSCQGDSGGPLVVTNANGETVLAGVVSWGEGCARANKYGVYSKVSSAIPWINAHMNKAPTK